MEEFLGFANQAAALAALGNHNAALTAAALGGVAATSNEQPIATIDPISAMVQELAELRKERHLMQLALGWTSPDAGSWPSPSETLTISEAWDGPTIFGKESFLSLQRGDRVRVEHRTSEGWLWGVVQSGTSSSSCPSGRSGWFGGRGCIAACVVHVRVPVGPTGENIEPPAEQPSGVMVSPPTPFSNFPSVTVQLSPAALSYCDRWGIDEGARRQLGELTPDAQSLAMEAELLNCRNPSAVFLSRMRGLIKQHGSSIKQREQGLAPGLITPSMAAQMGSPFGSQESIVDMKKRVPCSACGQHGHWHRDMDPGGRPLCPIFPRGDGGEQRGDRSRSPRRESEAGPILTGIPATSSPVIEGFHVDVEEWLKKHPSCDGIAARALRELPHDLQQIAMQTDIVNCRNPSAVLWQRIKALQTPNTSVGQREQPQQRAAFSRGLCGQQTVSVEDYIIRHQIDSAAAKGLRDLPREYQTKVMETELSSSCRNTSAVLMRRIRTFADEASTNGMGMNVMAQAAMVLNPMIMNIDVNGMGMIPMHALHGGVPCDFLMAGNLPLSVGQATNM